MEESKPSVARAVFGPLVSFWQAQTAKFEARRLYAESESSRLRIMATYRGGVGTRTSEAWSPATSYVGGTHAERQNMAEMRSRARRVYKDNLVGRTLLNTETDNIIADGMTLQARTDSKDFNREAEERWAEWTGQADIRGYRSWAQLQRAAWIARRVDGDCGVVLVDRGGQSKLQVVPGDWIMTPDGLQGKRNIKHGIEVDRASRAIAFHVADFDEDGKRQFSRIVADNFIYLPNLNDGDILQIRGETAYATIFDMLNHLDQYVDGVALAAWMATVFGIIFKEPNAAKQQSLLGTVTNAAGIQQKALRLENGMMKWMGTEGEAVQVDAKQPMQQTPEFVRMMLRLIGMPFDMPLEMVAKDMSQVNFASARIGLLGFYRACRVKQRYMIERFLSRVYTWWMDREIRGGRLVTVPPEGFTAHEFVARGWDYTDPVSEAQGDLLEITMGTKTPQMVAAERGRDLEAMHDDLERFAEDREARGLPPVLSTFTRDAAQVVDAQVDPNAPDPELERIKAEADAYGVGVRAGVITPQTEDENTFRQKLALPPMSEDAKRAWADDKGVRRPITLTQPAGQPDPVAPPLEPEPENPNE